MTLDTQTTKIQHTADGVLTLYTYNFKIFNKEDLRVIVTDTSGVDSEQVLDSDYTVSGVGVDSGGSINFTTTPTLNYTITILRDSSYIQNTQFVDGDNFPAESAEFGLDKIVLQTQQLEEKTSRGLQVNASKTGAFNSEIDTNGKENYFVKLKSDGTGFELVEGTPSASGESNTSSNLGAGEGLASAKSGADLPFKSLLAGSNITLASDANTVTINSTASGGGETNTSSNVGTGTGIFKQKSGVDFQFKSLLSGNGVNISSASNEITLSADLPYFNVTDYGATGDGSTDDTASINNAISAAVAETKGGVVFFPAGKFKITSAIGASGLASNKSLIFRGLGEEISNIFADTTDAIEVDFTAGGGWDGDKAIIAIENMTISTNQSGGYTAVLLQSNTTSSVAPVKRVDNVVFCGTGPAKYWDYGVDLVDCTFSHITNCRFQGANAAGTPITTLEGRGIRIGGSNNPVDTFINRCNFFAMRGGVLVEGTTEGVYIEQCAGVNLRNGVVWNTTGKEPLLNVLGCHFNTLGTSINLTNCIQYNISNNLLYQINPSDTSLTADWIGINVTTSGGESVNDLGIISNNTCHGFGGSGSENGIVIDNAGYCLIGLNRIYNVDTGLFLTSNSSNCSYIGNVTSTGTSVVDSGSSNTDLIAGGGGSSSPRYCHVELSGTTTLSTSSVTDIDWDREVADTDSIWDSGGTTTDLTVPSGVTKIKLRAQLAFDNSGGAGQRRIDTQKNGGDFEGRARMTVYQSNGGFNQTICCETPIITVSGGDIFTINAFQDGGSNVGLIARLTWAMMEIIE